MEILLEQSSRIIAHTDLGFKRHLFEEVRWDERLIGIQGARGVGKTTLVLQKLKSLDLPPAQAAYISLDDIYFTVRTLRDTAEEFYKKGGRMLAIDEVHKYPGWSQEIKNLHDFYPELKIVFTGSSIIDITKESGDLSRRALMYELFGLSYREYLRMRGIAKWPAIALENLLDDHRAYTEFLSTGIRPLEHFDSYLEHGYYPFGMKDPVLFRHRMKQVVRSIVETDMAELPGLDIRNARKMLQLIEVISGLVPFKPNLVELSEKTGIHRNSLNAYLHHLEQARILSLLRPSGRSTAVLQKPEKILIQNPSLLNTLARGMPSTGSVRETFVHSMLSKDHEVTAPAKGDFLVDGLHLLEVGGPSKKGNRSKGTEDAWIVKDGLETGSGKTLPIWVFGLLY